MSGYADTGFLASLFLPESTTVAAWNAAAGLNEPLPLIPLTMLEFRNTLNLSISRGKFDEAKRDALWDQFEAQIEAGFFREEAIPQMDLHARARELSDRHTPTLATRSLDLLHVAAATLLGAQIFYTFDHRQRKAAEGEGLTVKPE